MDNKNQTRCEYFGAIILVLAILLLVLYLVGPKSESGPSIRLLHFSCQSGFENDTTKKLKTNTAIVVNTSLVIAQQNNSSEDGSKCPQSNFALECSSTFPVLWVYDGYGVPNVSSEMFRRTDNFNDVSSYKFVATISFSSISERASGKYSCTPVSSEIISSGASSSFVHLFFPPANKESGQIFVITNDITVESDTEKELFVPCPIADPEANVSLIYNGQPVSESYVHKFLPETGFYLNAKFIEENDPFGTFYCEDSSNKKSGRVTIASKKASIVRTTPRNTTVNFNSDFNGIFKCEAKENITLKFRRVTNSKRISYIYNSASDFPFSAQVIFEKADLREGSTISCLTISRRIELHSWKVLLSMSGEIQLSEFSYKEDSDEFSCCSVSSKMPKLTKTECSNVPSCLIEKACVERRTCNTKSLKLTQKSTCVNYKLEYKRNMSSGLLHCWVDDTIKSYAYFAYEAEDSNITLKDFKEVSGETVPIININSGGLLESLLTIQEVNSTSTIITHEQGLRNKYRCTGPTFYFARGFKWQIARYGGFSDFLDGEEVIKDGWIQSSKDFEIAKSSGKTRRIYCFAPVWNSPMDWTFVTKEFSDL